MRLIHATHEGAHLYKFVRMRLHEIRGLRADGEVIDTDWLPQHDHDVVDHFLKFDHQVESWEEVRRRDVGRYERVQERENPFKFEIPEFFESADAFDGFASDHDLIFADEDECPLYRFYHWVPNNISESFPISFDVTDLGEITPCPETDFEWEPIQPHEVGVPNEMWHLGPVMVKRDEVRRIFWEWVKNHMGDLHISSMYPDQGGSIYFMVGGQAAGRVEVYKDRKFATVPQNLPKSPKRLASASCFTGTSFVAA
jgi:hypothetical protein